MTTVRVAHRHTGDLADTTTTTSYFGISSDTLRDWQAGYWYTNDLKRLAAVNEELRRRGERPAAMFEKEER